MIYTIQPILLLLLLLVIPLATALKCANHAHCNDGNPATHDMCLHKPGMCLSFSTDRQGTAVRRNIEDLIDELNEAPITAAEKRKTASLAARVLGQLNPNLFVYRNLAGTDPAKKLRQFAKTITEGTSNFEFHSGMADIFREANDFHTVYNIPAPFSDVIAGLGFTTTVFYKRGDTGSDGQPRRRYVVSDVIKSFIPANSSFGIGAELLIYNGGSVDDAVLREGDSSYANNEDAQIAAGTKLISLRGLIEAPLPKTGRSSLGYRTASGVRGEITLPWVFVQMQEEEMVASLARRFSAKSDVAADLLSLKRTGSMKKRIMNLDVDIDAIVPRGDVAPQPGTESGAKRTEIEVGSAFTELFSAETIKTKLGEIGRLEIKSFNEEPSRKVLLELVRVLQLFPRGGLVVDIRGNPGGLVTLAESVANVITGGTRDGFPLGWRAKGLLRSAFLSANMTESSVEVRSTLAAIESAMQVKEAVSGGALPLFSRVELSTEGFYRGPVVTVVDAETYSAGDVYAGLQVDERMSYVVGTAGRSGGGGASVVDYEELREVFEEVLPPLPNKLASFSTAIARVFRSGENEGAQIEFFGVQPHERYFPSRADALGEDVDLYEFLARVLAKLAKEG